MLTYAEMEAGVGRVSMLMEKALFECLAKSVREIFMDVKESLSAKFAEACEEAGTIVCMSQSGDDGMGKTEREVVFGMVDAVREVCLDASTDRCVAARVQNFVT